MSILTIILLVALVLMIPFAPTYALRLGVEFEDDEEVLTGVYFIRAPLVLITLMKMYYGRDTVKIISGKMYYEAYDLMNERETTSEN